MVISGKYYYDGIIIYLKPIHSYILSICIFSKFYFFSNNKLCRKRSYIKKS